MAFPSVVFLFVFLPATFTVYFLFRNRTLRNTILLVMSLFFYSWGEPHYVVLLIVSTIMNWGIALLLARHRQSRNLILAMGVGVNFLGIAVFKYAGFLIENLDGLFNINLPVSHLSLPIGISFYTFQAISYQVDVYRGHVAVQKNLVVFGTYLTLFTKIIAGPIVRYKHIESEMVSRRENYEDFIQGFQRFVIGLGKKVLIADTMGSIADKVLSTGPHVGAIPAWTGFTAYAFQIYFDFSAYSDMAIGLGQMFGFHFLENFDHPYVARSVTEFWRRWHISLSTFFRDYVYIPLGGNRVNLGRWLVNLIIVWGITGLWHGASWNFVLWGLYYGTLVACEKLFLRSWMEKAPRFLQHVFVILSFMFGWVIFRTEGFSLMGEWFGSMFGTHGWGHPMTLNALNVLHEYPWFIIAAVGSTPVVANFFKGANASPFGSWLVNLCIGLILVWSILEIACSGFSPFIYFQF
jgi:alginate O-acetyltransferase complex protein AlgI